MKVLLLSTLFIFISCTPVKEVAKIVGITPMSKEKAKVVVTQRPPVQSEEPNDPTNDHTNDPDRGLISCEKFCAKNQLRHLKEDPYTYLAFTNFGYMGIGRCRGHALLMQKLSILASFEPTGGCDTSDFECLETYKDQVRAILNYKTQEIKGFRNLHEFSDDLYIQSFLKGIVAGTPHRYRAIPGHIQNPNYETEQLNTFHEVKRRLAMGHQPYVGLRGKLTGAHAVIFYEDTYIGGRNVLCAKDPNYLSDKVLDCENYFYIENNNVYFKRLNNRGDFMTSFKITSDEDNRVKLYQKALSLRCLEEARSENLCK